ncbi:TaqI-like C-terminal specificity domain containing protein [Candidatus Methylopumilus planktonicus]|uniref:DUF7149 domain-containing protein n=1 Tax=Candidatus Methylopumilus planktonicus TaxID=1581557 RepID=UPI003BEF07B7
MSSKISLRKAINKSFFKVKITRNDVNKFKENLVILLDRVNHAESEEFNKNLVADFLKNTFFSPNYFINTKGRNDLVIYNGKNANETVGVIIETKRASNTSEMIKQDNINTKAMQELVLYYLRERISNKNLEVKNLIATNIHEWFVFDANIFEKHFAKNKKLVQQFTDFENGKLSGKTTDFFYNEIAQTAIEHAKHDIEYTYFKVADIDKALRNSNEGDDSELIPFLKLLSPQHLLKLSLKNDSNTLNKDFYVELLHIIGLEEVKDSGQKVIRRKKENERNNGTLIENSILQVQSLFLLENLKNRLLYGKNEEEQLFNVAIELVITWINRILFLKLLEAQLITYNRKNPDYSFLNIVKVKDFDGLNALFFQVLAVEPSKRNDDVREKFSNVPYLNSSLFEPSQIEQDLLFISNLSDDKKIPIISSTVLKNQKNAREACELGTLEYLFRFLDSFDFANDTDEEIKNGNKTLISASVLGLFFEKINGYKDGSFYTPSFVTMYMCKEALTKTVLHKINEAKGTKHLSLKDVYNDDIDIHELNEIVNSVKICDPAVGSGHFLVSALNEFLVIKSELGIIKGDDGKRLKNYSFTLENDELIVTDEDGEIFEYKPSNQESQRTQEILFNEKKEIIERCLFGVDINPNSVKICRLRLWIELLKNAYYKSNGELETLPNIDINIKCGNSLISRFNLDIDLTEAIKKSKVKIPEYKSAVMSYKNAKSKDEKRAMESLITDIKSGFSSEIYSNDRRMLNLYKFKNELSTLMGQEALFQPDKKEHKYKQDSIKKLRIDIKKLEDVIEEIKSNKIYEDAFEWRFEFPEVLNDEGDYIGFDLVIGNPPYIYRNLDISLVKKYYVENFSSTEGNFDLYKFFIELISKISKKNAYSTFIVSNTFVSAKSFSKLRELIINNFNIIELYELGLNVFEEALVENIIFIFQKMPNATNESVSIKIDHRKIKDINSPEQMYQIDLKRIYLKEKAFNIYLKQDTEQLINKIRTNTVALNDIAYCTVGINTGYIKDKLCADSQLDITYHKLINAKDISPYSINWKGEWIKYDKAYVDSFGDLGRSLPAEYIFTNNKILVQRTRRGLKRKLVCTYDGEAYYNLNRLSNIIINNENYHILYVLALLNSSVLDYYFNVVFNEYEIKPLHLSQLPIYKLNYDEQLKLVSMVETVLNTIKTNSSASINQEEEINNLVYRTYNLTDEEIAVIKLYYQS